MSGRTRIVFFGMVDGLPPKLAGIRRYAAGRGWEVVPVSSVGLPYGDIPAILGRLAPDGVIVGCNGGNYFPPKRLFGSIPVVYLDLPARIPGATACSIVSIDDEAVVRTAMKELGAWHPASLGVVEHYEILQWSRFRARAFREAARGGGLACSVFAAKPRESSDSWFARLGAWLAARKRPCGIFAVNDETAAFVIRACRERHLHVPKDIGLVGADDVELPGLSENPLSSVLVDNSYAGFLAAKMLGEILSRRVSGNSRRDAEPQRKNHARSPQRNEETSRTSRTLREEKPRFPASSASIREPNHVVVGPLTVVRRKSTSGRGRHIPGMAEAVSMIRAEACDGLTARALAARFPGTRRLFDMRFREATGHSVLDEILHVRMEKACDLLANTETPVGIVADFCGFGCYRALDRLFRTRHGMSMSEWRKRNRLR